MENIRNPFNPNSIVAPTLFAGRDEQTIGILKKLSDVANGMHASFYLHGERGIGKTALAKLIRHISLAKDKDFYDLDFLTSYYSVEQGQSLKDVIESSLNNLTDGMPESSLEHLSKRLGGLFKNGKFSFGAFGLNLKVDKNESQKQLFKDQIVSSLTNLIESAVISKKSEDKKFSGILIVIDEIHNVRDIKGAGQIFRNIINTLDVAEKAFVSFLLIGYSDSVEVFFKGDSSARRSFDFIHLKAMPREDAKALLIKGFEKIGRKYDAASLDKYIDAAGGYPHSLQMLGHNLIEIDSDQNISNGDWEQAIEKTAKDLQSKDFSDFYAFQGKPTLREELMNILALLDSSINKKNLAKVLEKKNIYSKSCLPKLIQQGAVREENGDLILQSTLFKTAILFHLNSSPQQLERAKKIVSTLDN